MARRDKPVAMWYRQDAQGEPVALDLDDTDGMRDTLCSDRCVLHTGVNRVAVSTVFLCVDHGRAWLRDQVDDYRPILWETMIFGGQYDGERERYDSRAAALAGHARWVALVNEAEGIFEHERAIAFE